MKPTVVIIFCSLIFLSCKTILIKSYGIQQPIVENENSLKEFLKENQFADSMEIYTFKSLETYHSAIKKASFPDAKFFNRNGYFVNYQLTPNDCNATIGPFIENARNINNLPFNDSITIYNTLEKVVEIENKAPVVIDKNADGYLVLYWAKFIGAKLNKEKSLDWITIYNNSKAKGNNIQLIFLNMDYQDFWGITEEDIPEFEF